MKIRALGESAMDIHCIVYTCIHVKFSTILSTVLSLFFPSQYRLYLSKEHLILL
jgi:hypothetical protein